jgi:HEAT repeat protein
VALEHRITDAVEPLYYALMSGDVDLRVRTAWRLSTLALNDTVADAVTSYLHRNPPQDVAGVVMALALVNAGRRPGVELPEATDDELRFALLARRTMLNQSAAADKLKAAVRDGEARERYQAACYLALSRARTAVPVFASVRDQDAPYLLRAFCAGSSIRRGHPAIDWFAKVLKSVRDRVNADIVHHLCRAVEDVVPVMLNRIDVNAGRFV